jgi:tRNA(adenine34) deaminase
MSSDIEYMRRALAEARLAAQENEVPVGAVLVLNNRILAQDHNRMVTNKDPLAHAEFLTMQTALKKHPVQWLLDTTLYVTLEPCVMCGGALVLARVKRLVIATLDPKAGACGSVIDVVRSPQFNHRVEVESGLLQEEASLLLKEFFLKLRAHSGKNS